MMAGELEVDNNGSRGESRLRPYAPSWINRLTTWLDRRSWPGWSFYLGLWLVLVSVLVGALWVEGIHPFGTFFPAQLFIPTMISLFLVLIHFLDKRAVAALETLRPALTASEEESDLLRYQLMTLPAVPTLLASLATTALIFLLGVLTGERESSIAAVANSPIAASLLLVVYYAGWWVFGTFIYHTIYQLGVISRTYAEHTRISLFAMSPLYAFSGVTALTALALAVATYGWTALNPDNLSSLTSIVVISLITILALAVFAWPMLGTRRILSREKAQRLDRVSLRYDAVFTQIHQQIENGELEEMGELTQVISILETERDMLNGISTWPWQPDTFRCQATALLLPLLLWIIQYVLQLMLGL